MPELLLPRLKREIEARLAELRPLVAEAANLEAAKRALLEDLAPSSRRASGVVTRESARDEAPAARRPRTAPSGPRAAVPSAGALALPERPSSARTARNGTAASEAEEPRTHRDVIVALVEERPGVSVAEIASVTKIAKPTVATTVSKLKREGVFADEAGGVKLASRQPVTLEQVAKALQPDTGSDDAAWEAAAPGKAEKALA